MKGWLEMRGVSVCTHDITTASGLGRAAELDAADLEVVPVLIVRHGDRELTRYLGLLPKPEELRRVIALATEAR